MSFRINKNKQSLNIPSRNVPNNKLSTVVRKLQSYMWGDNNAAGIAAIQLGMRSRAFAARVNGEINLFINPTNVKMWGEETVEVERCLSLKKSAKVKRYSNISFEHQLFDGWKKSTRKVEFEGYEARIIQHELDHLDGILICDKQEDK